MTDEVREERTEDEGREAPDEEFEALLEFIRDNRGFDFTGYKRPSLRRRIMKRTEAVGIGTFADYQAFLEANQHEFGALFDTILINVTGFFRDRVGWDFVAREVVPKIVAAKDAADPIRVWSAGCASGEEAYTLAMLFAEVVGEQDFRERVKIYATDVDERALTQGRHAAYTGRDLEDVPVALRERYFERVDGGWTVRSEFRRAVIFGRHDLVRDPPISRIDLLVCRNTLMYFSPETQSKILADFHFSLRDEGSLFLGKSEMLLTRTRLFQPVELRHRVFAKIAQPDARRRVVGLLPEQPQVMAIGEHPIRDASFDSVPVAYIALDTAGRLALTNAGARRLFGLTGQDVGRPLQDLPLSYRPIDLRTRVEELASGRHPVVLREVEWRIDGASHWFDVQLHLLTSHDGTHIGTAIMFTDVTRYREMAESLEHSKERLETAYEELQSTAEELETTNEELQSTNEELETTNEELQSTNEELETMNEELQSTNEELEATNMELRQRTDDLDEVNAFLQSVLGSLQAGVVVVDAELVVQSWNDHATDLWGLREDEVRGRHLQNLDIGLPVEQVAPLVRAAVAASGATEGVVDAVNRRGRSVRLRVRCTPLWGADEATRGVIVQMEEQAPESP